MKKLKIFEHFEVIFLAQKCSKFVAGKKKKKKLAGN